MMDQQRTDTPSDLTSSGVTAREAEVLALLGDQATHDQIAARLFISVRTVESHAKSMRQKLNLGSRQELLRYAAGYRASLKNRPPPLRPTRLPEPLTSFVGRREERVALADALAKSRLVTAVGPAGVGKTRLALTVARDAAPRYLDGACHLDLATLTDPAAIPQALATALGVHAATGQPMINRLLAVLCDRDFLLLLDNAEHLADPVAALVERLLDGCPGLDVLATSRIRLMVPFERVYDVPGLALPSGPEALDGDAVRLFTARATAFGLPEPTLDDQRRIARICRRLDGMALAIELAAARTPALGIDGVEQGIENQLDLLRGGSRAQARHRSLEHALAWSYRLLEPLDQKVLRRVAIFVSPFTAAAAGRVAGYSDVGVEDVPAALGRLVEGSLLSTVGATEGGTTRYRAWESIRQYATAQRSSASDFQVPTQHLRWCRAAVTGLLGGPPSAISSGGVPAESWYDEVDALADEARSALNLVTMDHWAHNEGAALASELADLLFRRGLVGEAKQRYEQAAELTEDPSEAHADYARAAQTAECAIAGEEALRLWRCSAAAAERAGRQGAQAVALARAAETIERWQGMFAQLPNPTAARDLYAAALQLGGDDKLAQATAAVAGLVVVADETTLPARAGDAIQLAQELGDPLLETAALDALTTHELHYGTLGAAAAHSRRRLELLSGLKISPGVGIEWRDALHMGVFTALGTGDLRAAKATADEHLLLPFLRGEGGLAGEEALTPLALGGDWETAITIAERCRADWERADRPCAPGRGMFASAMLMVHRLRADSEAASVWLEVVTAIRGVPAAAAMRGSMYGEVFDGIALLHQGAAAAAREVLGAPSDPDVWLTPIFLPWRSALLAEAAVLGGEPDAGELIEAAEVDAAVNPVAAAMTRRARGLHQGDRRALSEAADSLDAAGCCYQWARTLVFQGGDSAETGRDALAEMGAAPMSE